MQLFLGFPAKDAFISSGLFKEQALGSVRELAMKSTYQQGFPLRHKGTSNQGAEWSPLEKQCYSATAQSTLLSALKKKHLSSLLLELIFPSSYFPEVEEACYIAFHFSRDIIRPR